MKRYLILLLMAIIFNSFAECKLIIQGDLPKPYWPNKPEQTNRYSSRLEKHIASGDIVSFYRETTLIYDDLRQLKLNDYNDEILIDHMWLYYYIASVSLYGTDFDVTTSYAFKDDDDIYNKVSAILDMERMGKEDIMKRTSLNKKLIRDLLLRYSTKIFKDLRSACDPQAEATTGKIKKLPVTTIEQAKIRQNKSVIYARRNTILTRNVKSLEEELVGPIVRYNHGKANEVRRLIRLAGYTDEEGADLIDRTVGRHKHTEFLYQGKYGRRHDKKVEQGRKKK